MGFRSQVQIGCGEKAFNEYFKPLFLEHKEDRDFAKPDSIVRCGSLYVIKYDWVKWYEFYSDVQAIENIVEELIDKDEEGYEVKRLIVNEDNTVEEDASGRWLDTYCDYLNVVVQIDSVDGEEVSF